jgi:exonuclease SbcD
MRILNTADWHLNARGTIAGRYVLRDGVNLKLWDKAEAVRTICEYAEGTPHDLIVIPGDLFDTPNPENVAIKIAVDAIERLAEQAPVIIIRGNHEGGKGGEFSSALAPFGRIQRRNGIYVSERPEIIPIVTKQRTIQVFALPYPKKSALHTNPQLKNMSPEELNKYIGFKMEEILSAFTAQFDRNALNVLVGHFAVGGSMYSKEQTVPPFDIWVRSEFLDKFDLAMMGHLHMPQKYYSGTITRAGFGEDDMLTGFKVYEVEFSNRWSVKEEFIEIPSRRYITLDAQIVLNDGIDLEAMKNDGTVVRIKGRLRKFEFDEVARKIKALGFQFSKNAIEVESEGVRIDGNGDSSEEPTTEEAIRLWSKEKSGTERFLDSLVNAAKEIEYQWKLKQS